MFNFFMCRVILFVRVLHLILIETDPLKVKLLGSPLYIFGCNSTVYNTGSRSFGSLTLRASGGVVTEIFEGNVAPDEVAAPVEPVVGHGTTGQAEPEIQEYSFKLISDIIARSNETSIRYTAFKAIRSILTNLKAMQMKKASVFRKMRWTGACLSVIHW